MAFASDNWPQMLGQDAQGFGGHDVLVTMRSNAVVVRHRVELGRWAGPDMRIAVLADLHVAAPWTTLADIGRWVALVQAQKPDLVVLAGDYLAGRAITGRRAGAGEIVAALAGLSAPLGVWAILGNHDWQDCALALGSDYQQSSVVAAFEGGPVRLLRNGAASVRHAGFEFWLVGFDSQRPVPGRPDIGFHRPDQAFDGVPGDAATILLAHEPDYFAQGDTRAGLQISGHTHGGQLNLFGWRPMTPSRYGGKYAYGHIRDGARQMVVSGGLGFSGLPMRIGQPPEVTIIDVHAAKGGR